MQNRRNVLKTAALAPTALAVAGMSEGALFSCGSAGIQIDPNILVAINQAVATGCNFIPAITTVIALINVSFPAVLGATTIAESILKEISGMLCANAPTPAQAGKFGGAAKTMKAGDKEIPVNGWVVVDGKLQYV